MLSVLNIGELTKGKQYLPRWNGRSSNHYNIVRAAVVKRLLCFINELPVMQYGNKYRFLLIG